VGAVGCDALVLLLGSLWNFMKSSDSVSFRGENSEAGGSVRPIGARSQCRAG